MGDAGFTHVRINLIHAPGPAGVGLVACGGQPATLLDYERAVAAVRAAGLVPQLTLVWSHEADPQAIADWSAQMAAHFAPEVARFSILNEPDLTIPAADDCDPETVQRMVAGDLGAKIRWVKQYVRRGGHSVHRVFSGGWRKGRAYAPRWQAVYRWVRRSEQPAGDVARQLVLTVRQGCLKVQRGRIYRRIFSAAEPLVRAAAPGAQVLAGETSPVDGVDLFIGQVVPVHADGWAHHCYQWNLTPTQSTGGFGIGDTARVQALVGMPLFYTECGYPNPDSAWNLSKWTTLFTHDSEPPAYAAMWRFARDRGVREMSQYGWCRSPGTGWDTALMSGDGCDPSPEYRAVAQVLASWG
jgi:hypothetical protein